MTQVEGQVQGSGVWVLGAGTMGRQIALRCALSGHPVCLIDLSRAALDAAAAFQARFLDVAVARGDIAADQAARARSALELVSSPGEGTVHPSFAIEAIPEDVDLKRHVFGQLDRVCPPHTILATNSSSIPVSRLEDATSRHDRVVNMHFYQPLRTPNIVEIMAGSATTDEIVQLATTFVSGLGLVPLTVRRESLGFIFNRVWRAVKKECLRVVDEGIATVEDVDRAWMATVGTPIGPFGLMDAVGLDVVRDIEMSYHRVSGDPSDLPPPTLVRLVEQGRLGVKSGEGFYHYPHPAFTTPSFLGSGGAAGPGGGRLQISDLVGTWRLVSWENRYDDGRIAPAFPDGVSGYLLYTPDGYVSVHLAAIGRRPFASPDMTAATRDEAAAAFHTSIGYAGRFTLVEDRVLHHVELSTFPNWVGTTLDRTAWLKGGRLMLTTAPMPMAGGTAVAALTWERC